MTFLKTEYPHDIVHQVQNIMKYVSDKDPKELAANPKSWRIINEISHHSSIFNFTWFYTFKTAIIDRVRGFFAMKYLRKIGFPLYFADPYSY